MENSFKFTMPAKLSKSKDNDWIVAGLASTASIDKQGEVIDQAGLDLSEIDAKKGWFNWDHQPGIDNILGTLDSYSKTDKGLFVKGRLFKNKDKSKAVYEVMSSLGKSDVGRVGMSVEGKILERDAKNPKIIKKCKISKVALTLSPVNTDTYADLVKSLNLESDNLIKSIVESDIDFDCDKENTNNVAVNESGVTFSASQVLEIVEKALSAGAAGEKAPVDRSGGEALSQSSMKKLKKDDENEEIDEMIESAKKVAKLKKGSSKFFKSQINEVLTELQNLYPNNSRSEIFEAIKERLETKFDKIKEI